MVGFEREPHPVAQLERVESLKLDLLRRAAGRFFSDDPRFESARADFRQWSAAQIGWLDDYALFQAIDAAQRTASWTRWPTALARREPAAIAAVRAKKAPARLDDLRTLSLSEGLCVQTLHVGSFDDEAPLLERLHDEVIPEQGLRLAGLHHEVYLSDARRVAREKRRTILRQPVAPPD